MAGHRNKIHSQKNICGFGMKKGKDSEKTKKSSIHSGRLLIFRDL